MGEGEKKGKVSLNAWDVSIALRLRETILYLVVEINTSWEGFPITSLCPCFLWFALFVWVLRRLGRKVG